MTTERLNILAAALALKEFTAPELTAFSGANANTVRQVLYREQAGRGQDLFEKVSTTGGDGSGRPAVVWRLKDPETIYREIEGEESSLADMRSSTGQSAVMAGQPASSGWTALLTSAEDAAARSCESDNPGEQRALVAVAKNLLDAANPDPGGAEPGSAWWEHPAAAADEAHAYQACRTAAFAALAARRAARLPVQAQHLKYAAITVATSSTYLPRAQTMEWIRRIVNVSSAEAGYLPPIAVLMRPGQSPAELFPIVRSPWRCIRAQASLARPRFTVWAEEWAQSLLAANIMPALIVAHDSSLESNDLVDKALAEAQESDVGPVVIVASTAQDLHTVAWVTQGGGYFYPLRETFEGLLETVWHTVAKAVGLAPSALASNPVDLRTSRGSGLLGLPDQRGNSYHFITASRVARFPYHQLEYWTRTVLADPAPHSARNQLPVHRYTFRDILALKAIKVLTDSDAPLERIKSAVAIVRDTPEDELAAMTILNDEEHATGIAVRDLMTEAESDLATVEEELRRRLETVAQADIYAASMSETTMRDELAKLVMSDKGKFRAIGYDFLRLSDGLSSERSYRLPVYVVVDASEAMRSHEELLNDSIAQIIETLLSEPQAHEFLPLTIIEFNSQPRVLRDMHDAMDDVTAPRLICRDAADYAPMLDLVRSCIDRDVSTLAAADLTVLRPLVTFLINRPPAADTPMPLHDPGWWARPECVTYCLDSSEESAARRISTQAAFIAEDDTSKTQALSSALTSVLRSFGLSAQKRQLHVADEVAGFRAVALGR